MKLEKRKDLNAEFAEEAQRAQSEAKERYGPQ